MPLAFVGLPVYLHSPDFYAREHGASLASIGAVLLALRLVDAIQDPLLGMASDRFRHRRRAVIAIGMATMAAGFWMLFHPPQQWLVAWFAASVLLCTTGYSIVAINFFALGGLWVTNPAGRTRITGWREAAGLVGLLLASAAPTLLGFNDDPGLAFHRLNLVFLPLLAIAAAMLFYWMSRAQIAGAQASAAPLLPAMKKSLGSRWNMGFFGIFFLNAFAGSIPAVLVVFFVSDRLGAQDMVGAFFFAYFLSGALSMPAWRVLSEKIGKERAWLWGMLLAVATFFWASFLGNGDVAAFFAICFLSGLALGSDLSLPPSILADMIAKRRDEEISSSYFSVMTFMTKAAFAMATGVSLPLLGLMGYEPGEAESATAMLSVTYAALPCALKVGVALLLYLFLRTHGPIIVSSEAKGHAQEPASAS